MMKNRNLNKLLVLVLSVALLVCAAVGISAVANENAAADPTVSVVGYVADYDGEAKIAYYVTTANAENLTAKLVLGTVNVGDTLAADAGKVAEGELTVDGETPVTLDVFYSDGVDPKDFRDDITATVVLVDADNKVVAAAAAITTTVYDSSMTLFNGGATEAQLKMHTLLLKYAAAVQAVVDPDSESADYKWADEIYIVVDGENTTGYRANLLDTYEAPIATADRFDADGKYFTGWTDAEGEAVVGWLELTIDNIQPGTTTLVRNYEALEGYESFDGDALPENATFNRNDTGFANVADGTLAFGKVDDVNNGSNIRFAADRPGVYATEYIFETDFNIESWDMTQKTWVYKFCLWAAGEGNNAEMTNIIPTLVDADTYSVGGVICKINTWHHLKMVVAINDGILTTTFTVDGKVVAGGFQASIYNAGEYRMLEAGVSMRDSTLHDCANTTLLLDNTAVKVVGDPATYTVTLDPNGATLENNTITVTAGQAYELPTLEGDAPFVGWFSEDGTPVAANGTWTYIGDRITDENNVQYYNGFKTLVAKWATPVKVILNANGGELAATEVNVYSGTAYKLPAPTLGTLAFGGWYDADGNVVATAGTWPTESEAEYTLTAKWFSAQVTTYDDKVNVTANNYDLKDVTDKTAVDPAGTMYVFSTDYTYHGLTSFTVTDGVVARQGNNSTNYGFVKLTNAAADANRVGYSNVNATGNWVNAEGKVVVDENGKLLDEFASLTAEEIFYENFTWGGYTFKIGQTYHIEITVTMNGADAASATITSTVTDADGNATNIANSFNLDANKGKTLNQFRFEKRGASSAKVTSFNFTHTFANTTFDRRVEATEINVALDANGGALPEGAANSFSILTGAAYTLPTPTLEGYAFIGWFYGNTPVATKGQWMVDTDATLVAKWAIETSHSTDFEDGVLPSWITGGGMTVENGALQVAYSSKGIQFLPVETVVGASAGTKYVFEMDFTLNSVDAASDNNLAFIGFSHTNATWQTGTHKWSYLAANGAADAVTMYGNKLNEGTTYSIRFEFVVTGANTGDLAVYINGEAGSATATTIDKLNTGDFYQFNIQWRGAANNRNLSATIDNVLVSVQTPADKAVVTLDPTGGALAEGTANTVEVATGAAYTLPTPTADGFEFVGWFNGDTLIPLTGTWAGSEDVTLKAKWLDATVCTYDDMEVSKSAWSNNIKWVIDGYDAAVVDATGTKYVYNTKYTYKGMTNFAITDGVVAPITEGASEAAGNRNFGFPRFIGADAAGATGKIAAGANDTVKPGGKYVNAEGVVVVDETGKLLDEFATLTADQIFYETLTWGNMTFKIGVEYDLTITAVMGADSKFAVTAKAVAADGTVDEGSLGTSNAVVNIQHFYLETRGANYTGAYTVTHSFTGTTFTKYVAVDSVVQAPVVEETPEETPAE